MRMRDAAKEDFDRDFQKNPESSSQAWAVMDLGMPTDNRPVYPATHSLPLISSTTPSRCIYDLTDAADAAVERRRRGVPRVHAAGA